MTEEHGDNQATPSQHMTASDGGTIKDVIQAVISGQVTGDVHIGDKIYTRSEVEKLWDYMRLAVAKYTARLLREVSRAKRNLPDAPYRSLEHFDLAHSAVFFGREQDVNEFLARIEPETKRLTLLHAPSGAGKTSFIRAGLEPALWDRQDDLVLYARAFTDPVTALKQIIANVGGPGIDLAHLSLHDFLQWFSLSLEAGQRLIIFLDQFEEFFIHLPKPTQASFIEQLGHCLEDKTLPVGFVLSLRKDYLAEMEAFKERIPDVFHNTFPLPPLTREQAASAIIQPAEPFGIVWAPKVVDALLNYLAKGKIAPPHLQLICTRLYEHVVEVGAQQITACHLDNLGGLAAIHKDYLVNEMQALRGPQGLLEREEVGWRLLKALVTTQGTKAPRTPDYLRENIEANPEVLAEVLDRLVQRRVLRKDSTPQGETIIEIAHDTLAAEIQARESPQEIRAKAALELIERELLSHRAYPDIVMSEERLRILDEYKDDLPRLNPEAAEFIFQSATHSNHEVKYWADRVVQAHTSDTERIYSFFQRIRRTIIDKLDMLELTKSRYGFNVPISLERECSETRETVKLLVQEIDNLRENKKPKSHPHPTPNSDTIDSTKSIPDMTLSRRWLDVQERQARFTILDIPVSVQTQLLVLREHIATVAAQANCNEDQVLGKVEFAEDWLASLERQFDSLFRSYEMLERKVNMHGIDVPLDILNALDDILTRLTANILERWNDFYQPDSDDRKRRFETRIVSERIAELQTTITRLEKQHASGDLKDTNELERARQEFAHLKNLLQRFG